MDFQYGCPPTQQLQQFAYPFTGFGRAGVHLIANSGVILQLGWQCFLNICLVPNDKRPGIHDFCSTEVAVEQEEVRFGLGRGDYHQLINISCEQLGLAAAVRAHQFVATLEYGLDYQFVAVSLFTVHDPVAAYRSQFATFEDERQSFT